MEELDRKNTSDPASDHELVVSDNEFVLYGGDFFDHLHIGITQLIMRLETIRWQKADFAKFSSSAQNYSVFMRATKYIFHRQFHPLSELYFDEHSTNETNMEKTNSSSSSSEQESASAAVTAADAATAAAVWNVEYKLSFVGTTSFTIHGMIENERQEPKKLVDILIKFVRVDPETRRPIPIEDDVRERNAAVVGSGTDIEKPGALLNENKKKLIAEFSIQANHIDLNDHANYATYINFSERTAIDAAAENVYPSIDGELRVKDVESFAVYYDRECRLGDKVQVHTWEGAPRQLHFQVFKDATLLAYIVMTMFDGMPLSVL